MDKQKLDWVLKNVARYLEPSTEGILSKYAQLVPENGVIVDVGTMGGGSAFILATSSKPSVQVYTIDPTPHPSFFDNLKILRLEDRVHQLLDKSEEVGKRWDKPIDLWFEDCWHEYRMMKISLEIWLPHIKKGAWMIWHDYDIYGNKDTINLRTAIDEGVGKQYEKIERLYNVFVGRKI